LITAACFNKESTLLFVAGKDSKLIYEFEERKGEYELKQKFP